MDSTSSVRCELEDGLAVIVLNRPEVLNAIDNALLDQLEGSLLDLRDDATVSGVVITGAVAVNHLIETLDKLVVAAVNGYAFGGGLELAEACMLRVASRDARFGHPEVKIGAIAGFGGTTRLPRLIGRGRAAELLLTGRTIGADEAIQMGLVNRVVEPGRHLDEAKSLVREIGGNAPRSVQFTWQAMHRGENMTLEESAALGADYFGLVASSRDFREGTRAFLQKESPEFTGS